MTNVVEEVSTFLMMYARALGVKARVESSTSGQVTVFTLMPATRRDASPLIGHHGKAAILIRQVVDHIGKARQWTLRIDVGQPEG